jgi:hypothetical protein
VVTEPTQIQSVMYNYYKSLFGKQQRRNIKLRENFWAERESVESG